MKREQVDLHMHTVASDGTQTPEELLKEVVDKDIKVFAITDHDSVDSIDAMCELAKATDRVFLPGVEISTTYKEKEFHLLTYGVDTQNPVLQEILKDNQKVREAFNIKIIEHIQQKNHSVSVEEYLEYQRDPSWGGWKAENYLREIGAIHHLGDLFGMLHDMEEQMTFQSPATIIPQLKSMGVKIVLAHPPAYYGGDPLSMDMLDHFRKLGVDGIECFSPYYKEEIQSAYYVDYCKAYDLMISCGSDYHGAFIKTRHMGHPNKSIDELMIHPLLK